MRLITDTVPSALAATAQAVYGLVGVGCDTAVCSRDAQVDGSQDGTSEKYQRLREEARQAGTPMGHDAFHKSYIRFVELIQRRKMGGVRIVASKLGCWA